MSRFLARTRPTLATVRAVRLLGAVLTTDRSRLCGQFRCDSISRYSMVDRKITIALLSVVAIVIATASVIPQTRALAITRVSIVDVVDGRILQNSTLTIRGK